MIDFEKVLLFKQVANGSASKVSTKTLQESLSTLVKWVLESEEPDNSRIQQLKQQIANGTYRISSHAIAKGLLS